jgi:hypothetical protein
MGYTQGEFLRRQIAQKREGGGITVTLTAAEGTYIPPRRNLLLRFPGTRKRPRQLSIDGSPVAEGSSVSGPPNWRMDEDSGELVCVMADTRKSVTVRVID